jgi:DNA-binding response OmpR family regulator
MVVEDDPDLRQLIQEACVGSGYQVLTSDTALDAIGKLQRQRVNLIILDMGLRQGDGEFLLREIRMNNPGGNAKTPILVASGTLDYPLIQRTKTEVQGVLLKPYSVDELIQRAKSLLGAKAA